MIRVTRWLFYIFLKSNNKKHLSGKGAWIGVGLLFGSKWLWGARSEKFTSPAQFVAQYVKVVVSLRMDQFESFLTAFQQDFIARHHR